MAVLARDAGAVLEAGGTGLSGGVLGCFGLLADSVGRGAAVCIIEATLA